MPRRARQVCPTPGCPTLTQSGHCPSCVRARARARPTAHALGYDRRWQRTRAAYLEDHPYCECAPCAGLPELLRPLAEEVHHLDGLGPRGPRGHDPDNLQALTKAHHSRETGRDHGFGARS